MPVEIELGRLVNRFGAQAVYGRALGLLEMRRITLAENIERACQKWKAPNAGKWFQAHPDDLVIFDWAKKAYTHG